MAGKGKRGADRDGGAQAPATDAPQVRAGRATSLNDDVHRIVCDAVRIGVPITKACALAGVTDRTYYLWMERAQAELEALEGLSEEEAAQREPSVYLRLLQGVTRARAEKVNNALETLHKMAGEVNMITGQRDWKIVAWMLERTEQSDFTRQTKTEVSGPNGGPVPVDLLSFIARATGGGEGGGQGG